MITRKVSVKLPAFLGDVLNTMHLTKILHADKLRIIQAELSLFIDKLKISENMGKLDLVPVSTPNQCL